MLRLKGFLGFFMLITVLHLSEHLAQGYQLWVLHWKRPDCLGVLGLWQPWLVRSEWLHYGHALFMLWGLWVIRPHILTSALLWWDIALGLQFGHHLEHLTLLVQAIIHNNIGNFTAPVSLAQLVAQSWYGLPFEGQPVLPRIELHLFYNLLVFVPMIVGLLIVGGKGRSGWLINRS